MSTFIPKRVKIYNYSDDVKEVIEVDHMGFGRSGGRKGKLSEEVTEEDRQRNLKRVKRNCRRLAFANNLNIHLVLTYRENMQDIDKADEDFKQFMKDLHLLYPYVKYLATRELQKRGAVHYHVLLNQRVDNKKVQNLWNHGFISLMQHQNKLKAIMYVLKYISKEVGTTVMKTKNGHTKKAYLSSKGLKNEVEKCTMNLLIREPEHYVKYQRGLDFMMTNLTEGWDLEFDIEVDDKIKLHCRSMLKCTANNY